MKDKEKDFQESGKTNQKVDSGDRVVGLLISPVSCSNKFIVIVTSLTMTRSVVVGI